MDLQTAFNNLAPGETLMNVRIVSETKKEFIVLRKDPVFPFAIKVVAKQKLQLIDDEWKVVSTEFY